MYSYNLYQWIIFFAIYCFIGWAGESLYVSWEYKKWVNRGFLHGPFLPIYGSGAIIMLFATLPVRDNVVLVFLLGMLSATALEYLTGYVMEKIFKARYWDYTCQPFNLNGYICLGCSITWGLCAELLINIIHKPVENLVMGIHKLPGIIIAIVFTMYFISDLITSAKEAFDLRKIILETIENNEKLRRLQKRIDVVVAVTNDDIEKFRERAHEKREEFQEKLEEKREEFQERKEEFAAAKERFKSKLDERRHRSAYRILKRNPGTSVKKSDFDIEKFKENIRNKLQRRE